MGFPRRASEYLGEKGIILKVQGWPYDEISRVPFMVRLPDGTKTRDRVESFVGMPDIMPTILHFLGIKSPANLHGKSVLPLVTGEEPDGERDFGIAGFYAKSCSIRKDGWSYYSWTSPHPTKIKSELYKFNPNFTPLPPWRYVRENEAENRDLIKEEPERAQHLELKMLRFLASLKPNTGDLLSLMTRIREDFVYDFRKKIGPHSE